MNLILEPGTLMLLDIEPLPQGLKSNKSNKTVGLGSLQAW